MAEADRTAAFPDAPDLQALDAKLNALLPAQYQHCYNDVQPASMGSAGLKYGPDGKVAWDDIWTTFCDLALAGGPPHRGSLLEPVPEGEALADPEKYQAVVEEIGRGIWLVTRLHVLPRIAPGWIGVCCLDATMAAWLVRAIVVENISARHERAMLYLPAGPQFQLAREIKNVITTVAKTCHYWTGHMPATQKAAAAAVMQAQELLQPATPAEVRAAPAEYQAVVEKIAEEVRQSTALLPVPSRSPGWVGFDCRDVATAVWLLRALIVENVLVRREEQVLYLPARPTFAAADSQRVVGTLARAWSLWTITRASR